MTIEKQDEASRQSQTGAAATEYALLLVLLSVAVAAAVPNFRNAVTSAFTTAGTKISTFVTNYNGGLAASGGTSSGGTSSGASSNGGSSNGNAPGNSNGNAPGNSNGNAPGNSNGRGGG